MADELLRRKRRKRTLVVIMGLAAAWVAFQLASGPPTSLCAKSYAPLARDGVLSIAVTFGYKDARPMRFVGDRYERAAFSDLLLRPCWHGEVVCGFENERDNPEMFSKKVDWFDGHERLVQVQVLGSSVSPDDDWNRENPYQPWYSERTSRLFHRAIAKSDVVFYNGHSRIGGGPDFYPPIIYRSGAIQYEYYRDERPGLKDLLEDLAKTKGARRPRLLGLFSCASDQHFLKEILRVKPKMGVINSEALLYQSDAMQNMVAALTALLRGECDAQFNDRLRSSDPAVGSKIVGFF